MYKKRLFSLKLFTDSYNIFNTLSLAKILDIACFWDIFERRFS